MIALLAISVELSPAVIRSHWFALSSTVMSSGLAIGLLSRPRESQKMPQGRVRAERPPAAAWIFPLAEDLAADAPEDVSLLFRGQHERARSRGRTSTRAGATPAPRAGRRRRPAGTASAC